MNKVSVPGEEEKKIANPTSLILCMRRTCSSTENIHVLQAQLLTDHSLEGERSVQAAGSPDSWLSTAPLSTAFDHGNGVTGGLEQLQC